MDEPGMLKTPESAQNPVKRPVLLTVLCILTFVGSGMNLVSSLFISAFYDVFVEIAAEFADRFNIPGVDLLTSAGANFFLVSALCYAASITGAVFMMRLRKTGFHIYTISQILLVIAPMYFMHLPSPGFADIFFSGLFIILYSANLKSMS
jgi:hypothetical protein